MRRLFNELERPNEDHGGHHGLRLIGDLIPEVLRRHGIDPRVAFRESPASPLSFVEPVTIGLARVSELIATA
jgi:hypothetical protein